jgi:hypothetical protein
MSVVCVIMSLHNAVWPMTSFVSYLRANTAFMKTLFALRMSQWRLVCIPKKATHEASVSANLNKISCPYFPGTKLNYQIILIGITGIVKESNQVSERLTLVLRVREVPGSNIDSGTGYSDWGFRGFSQYLQTNSPRPLLTKSFPIHHY